MSKENLGKWLFLVGTICQDFFLKIWFIYFTLESIYGCIYQQNNNTVEPLLSDPLLTEFSIIQPQTHSPNSI